jgi:hypothetical protein
MRLNAATQQLPLFSVRRWNRKGRLSIVGADEFQEDGET